MSDFPPKIKIPSADLIAMAKADWQKICAEVEAATLDAVTLGTGYLRIEMTPTGIVTERLDPSDIRIGTVADE